MNFYNTTHLHYCGCDLHARSLYVCIILMIADSHRDMETLLQSRLLAV